MKNRASASDRSPTGITVCSTHPTRRLQRAGKQIRWERSCRSCGKYRSRRHRKGGATQGLRIVPSPHRSRPAPAAVSFSATGVSGRSLSLRRVVTNPNHGTAMDRVSFAPPPRWAFWLAGLILLAGAWLVLRPGRSTVDRGAHSAAPQKSIAIGLAPAGERPPDGVPRASKGMPRWPSRWQIVPQSRRSGMNPLLRLRRVGCSRSIFTRERF